MWYVASKNWYSRELIPNDHIGVASYSGHKFKRQKKDQIQGFKQIKYHIKKRTQMKRDQMKNTAKQYSILAQHIEQRTK